MKKLIPAYVRVPLLFAIVFAALEYFIDSGDKPAFIKFPMVALFLGVFDTPEEASEYYQAAIIAIEKGTEIITAKRVNSSKYKGVYWYKTSNKWGAQYLGKYLGSFHTEEEAYKRVQLEIKNITFVIN